MSRCRQIITAVECTSWNAAGAKKRIDELGLRVDQRFDAVDQRFEQVDKRFERLEAELREFRVETDRKLGKVNEEFVAVRREMKEGFEAQRRLLIYGIVGTCASIVAGFGAVAGVLAAVV
ncbi:MAG TPA: hypothetical protein VHA54_09645 [Solirubrobacterales bacterium]|nr:hypothetical protein [Solirubrobacterales bacterium]